MRNTARIFLLMLITLLTLSAAQKPDKGQLPTKTKANNDRFQLLSFLVKVLAGKFDKEEPKKIDDGKNITIMTWNILAPMWIDRAAMKSRGVVDLNLLHDDVRLILITERLLAEQPDIVHLQEVQEGVYETIKDRLSEVYTPVGFAPNIKQYWKSFLREGQPYMKNGVATFYKKKRFSLLGRKSFETSNQGSIAQLTVLRRRQPFRKNRPIILVNCHLEPSATLAGVTARTIQGNAIMAEAQKQLVAYNNSQSATLEPVIILVGDLNTQNPFPAFMNFKSKGYLSAAQEFGNMSFPTLYYEFPLFIPGPDSRITDNSAIDHVLIRGIDVASGKVSVISANAPRVNTTETTEKSYIKRLTKILLRKLAMSGMRRFWIHLRSPLFTTITKAIKDDKGSTSHVNQVLRLGSDHFPLTVTLQIT